jgi:hypothetical protein
VTCTCTAPLVTAFDITLFGCDTTTRLYDVELTEDEVATLTRIAGLTSEHGGGCAPTMQVAPAPPTPADAQCGDCYQSIRDGSRKRNRYGDWIHTACPDGGVG